MAEYPYTEPKQKLQGSMESICPNCFHNVVCRGVANQPCIECNQFIPAADVRPVVRGRWIKYAPDNSDMMTCSECEKYWILDGDQYDHHFCPNCGADMREES